MDPVVLSGSSLATFLRCGQQWYFAYVANIKSPPTIRQAIGLAAHTALELNMRQKIETGIDLPKEQLLDEFSDRYDIEVYDAAPDEHETPEAGKTSGLGLVSLARERVLPSIQPILVEAPVQFAINGIPYAGVIDLVDSRSRIRDWKTTKRAPSGAGTYILNMTGYALGYRHYSGMVESEVVLDHLVRTKKPQYIPLASGGPIDRASAETFASIVENVYEQIQLGRFVPNGLVSQACSWCGYREICPAYKAKSV